MTTAPIGGRALVRRDDAFSRLRRALIAWRPGTAELPLGRDPTRRFIVWMSAIMALLVTLTLALMLVIGHAVAGLDRGLAGRATVQIIPDAKTDTATLETRVAEVVALLRATPGVTGAQPLPLDRLKALLGPWLDDGPIADVPMPRIIDVAIDPERLDGALLEARLAQSVPGARFADHGPWREALRRWSDGVSTIGAVLCALVSASAAAAILFATLSGLAIHRGEIEVLHLMGAADGVIARSFARHALWLSLQGSTGGFVVAALVIALLERAEIAPLPGLLPSVALGGGDWAILALVPLAAVAIATLTAHQTALQHLARQGR